MTAAIPVLFLDVDFRPLRVEGWQRAIADMMLGKCEVIEYSKDRTIRGVDREYPLPSVVRILRRFKRERMQVKFSRLNIYARDRFVCQYDGKRYPSEELTFDHVIPRARGGQTNWTNIVACCVSCNAEKADRTPEQAGMKLIRKPAKPAFLPVVTVQMNGEVPESWRPYWVGALETT